MFDIGTRAWFYCQDVNKTGQIERGVVSGKKKDKYVMSYSPGCSKDKQTRGCMWAFPKRIFEHKHELVSYLRKKLGWHAKMVAGI